MEGYCREGQDSVIVVALWKKKKVTHCRGAGRVMRYYCCLAIKFSKPSVQKSVTDPALNCLFTLS